MSESLGELLSKAMHTLGEFEEKKIVRTQAGANKYKVPIGAQIGSARNTQNEAANKNPKARAEYTSLMQKYPTGKVNVGSMSTADLENLSRLAYSFRSSNSAVVAARESIASELSKRGLDVRNFGSLAPGKGKTSKTTAKAKATVKKTVAKKKIVKKPVAKKPVTRVHKTTVKKKPAKATGHTLNTAASRGVAAPHRQAE